jgi:hypothetical protein
MRLITRPAAERDVLEAAIATAINALDRLTPSERTWMTDDHRKGECLVVVIDSADSLVDVVRTILSSRGLGKRGKVRPLVNGAGTPASGGKGISDSDAARTRPRFVRPRGAA